MSIYAHVDGLGAVIEECIADTVLQWRREFRSGHRTEDTFALYLNSVDTHLSLRPQGLAILTVQTHGRGFQEVSTQCFRLKRITVGAWKVSASSLKEK